MNTATLITFASRRTYPQLIYLLLLASLSTGHAEDRSVTNNGYCDHYNPERQVFYGDTHVHTSLSFDAVLWDTRNTPTDAYRFAKGASLGVSPYYKTGKPKQTIRLKRPLDFAMVSDHAEGLGLVEICKNPLIKGYKSLFCRMLRHNPSLVFQSHLILPLIAKELSKRDDFWDFLPSLVRADKQAAVCGKNEEHCRAATASPWKRIQDAAHIAYDRTPACTFTTFVGYEWTGYTQANIHRNVLFRNEHVIPFPVSFNEVRSASALWDVFDRECVGACDVITIPHNSNVSLGLMFPPMNDSAGAYNFRTARASQKYERVAEIMQHKGDSECWYGAGAEDELCAFEKLPFNTLGAAALSGVAHTPQPSDGYLRHVLSEGLRYYDKLGVNPWQLGFIASTDNHLGTPGAVDERSHIKHTAAADFIPYLANRSVLKDSVDFNPGGLAAVWAEENTRDAIFTALKRREVFGTSGPRIQLRFFAGIDYPKDMCASENRIQDAYAGGVPMGGTLEADQLKGQRTLRFMVYAGKDTGTKDASGTDLQRIQIIKGVLDKNGKAQEYVYDVSVAENSAKAGVNTQNCEQSGSGAKEMCAVWEDYGFDAQENAWYYARAVENPSCRWSQYACNALGVDCSKPDTVSERSAACCRVPATIQERAWSSPIWYFAQ